MLYKHFLKLASRTSAAHREKCLAGTGQVPVRSQTLCTWCGHIGKEMPTRAFSISAD